MCVFRHIRHAPASLFDWSFFSVFRQEDNWINDPNAFVADEDDEMDTYSLRIAGHDFISVRSPLFTALQGG